MSFKAFHAMSTFIVGLAVGVAWLRAFWSAPRRAPAYVLAAPIAAGLLGLSHWVAYDFAVGHWAGDFSLAQALFNFAVAALLLARRATTHEVVA